MKETKIISKYYIRHSKGDTQFTYTGNLEDALKKAESDLEKVRNDSDFVKWSWLYDLVKKKIDAHLRKKSDLELFIKCAQRQLKEQSKNEK